MQSRTWLFLSVISLTTCLVASASFSQTSNPNNEGNQLLKTGRWTQALRAYENVLKQDPQNLEARFQRGCALALVGQYESAIKAFEEILSNSDAESVVPFAHFNAGVIYYKLAMLRHDDVLIDKQQFHFAKVLSFIPNFVLAHDMITFSSAIGKKSTLMTIDAVGIPPDTAMFLKPSSDKETAVYAFDEKSVPMLYFYRSPAAILLLTNKKTTRDEIIQQIEAALRALDREPDTPYNRFLKKTASLSRRVAAQNR